MLGGVNKTHLFLKVLEAGESRMNILADAVLGESSLPGLQKVVSLLHPHRMETGNSGVSSFHKGTNHIMGAPPLCLHLNLNYLPKPLSPNITTLGIRGLTY